MIYALNMALAYVYREFAAAFEQGVSKFNPHRRVYIETGLFHRAEQNMSEVGYLYAAKKDP